MGTIKFEFGVGLLSLLNIDGTLQSYNLFSNEKLTTNRRRAML